MSNAEIINFIENKTVESVELLKARDNANEYSEQVPSKSVCSFLKAFTKGKKEIVELETSFGIIPSYLDLKNQQFTTIDPEIEKQNVAKNILKSQNLLTAKTKPNLRFINSEINSVLKKIAENSYDLIFFNSYKNNYDFLSAINAINKNGFVIINNILLNGKVANPSNRDDDVIEVRDFLNDLDKNNHINTTLLPINETLLLISQK